MILVHNIALYVKLCKLFIISVKMDATNPPAQLEKFNILCLGILLLSYGKDFANFRDTHLKFLNYIVIFKSVIFIYTLDLAMLIILPAF